MILTILSITSSLFFAFCAAYRHDFDYKTYEDYFENHTDTDYKYSREAIIRMNTMNLTIEGLFLVQICLSFFTEYKPIDSIYPVRDISKIAERYLKGNFIFHLIPIFPFGLIINFKNSKLLQLLKCLRLIQANELLDTKVLMRQVKSIYQKQLEKDCQHEERATEQNEDYTKIFQIVLIKYLIQTFRLILSILIISYYVGIFLTILFQLVDQLEDEYLTFQDAYNFKQRKPLNQMVAMTYYAFTTLSTVGFGDFHPKNHHERIVIIFVLILGVATFSYIMSIFIDILTNFQQINDEFQEDQKLTRFFGLMRRLNCNKDLNPKTKNKIIDYFEYKWRMDRNQAICTSDDFDLLSQLPNSVQRKLYTEYLFASFSYKFRRFFIISNLEVKQKHAYYRYENPYLFDAFMIKMLQSLLPINFKAKEVLY